MWTRLEAEISGGGIDSHACVYMLQTLSLYKTYTAKVVRSERKGGFGAALFSPLVILIVGSFCVIGDLPAEFEVGINKCRRFSVKTNPEPTTE